MSYLDHAALLRHGYDAMTADDAATVVAMFADDGVLHVNTDGPFGGGHQGHDAIAETLAGLVEWTGGTLWMEVQDIIADETHGVTVIHETATRARDGATPDVTEVHLCRFHNGRIAELWDIPAPSAKGAHDGFFS